VVRGLEVVLVDDDALAREWVRATFARSEFRLAGIATSVEEALRVIPLRRPDLALIDLGLPDGTGVDVVRGVRRLGLSLPALVMSAGPDAGLNEAVREAGGQGTILKTGVADEILGALHEVAGGSTSFDSRYPRRVPGRTALSPRERQVLALVARGQTNREAARELGIGEQTVKTLLARTYAKLGVNRRSEAVAAAYERGLL
jgi:DNA-binding NarL/FixJ family response regulator